MSLGASVVDGLVFLQSFARTRWGYRFRSREQFDRWQAKQRQRFLLREIGAVPFYADKWQEGDSGLPLMDKGAFLHHFQQLNRVGVSLEQALALGLRAERERDFTPVLDGGITVGLSSGTSGARGVFLVSPRERSHWAGAVLARVLSPRALQRLFNPMARRLTVAFFLRANSNLYTSVHGVRLHFYYGDLLQPMSRLVARLNQLQPDLLIAPASVLRQFAQAQRAGTLTIHPLQVVSVAEVLESDDARFVAQAWKLRVEQIYQCMEGFLGYTCSAGHLHLNEEFVHIEPQWLDEEHTRFTPLITDFTRRTQMFVRYHLDDVLRIHPGPCPCGRVTLRVAAIEGRQDDVLWLPRRSEEGCSLAPIFPDMLRRAFLVGQGPFSDYRLEQQELNWIVRLDMEGARGAAQEGVRRELLQLCQASGCVAAQIVFQSWQAPNPGQKRRRIRCLARPQMVDPQ